MSYGFHGEILFQPALLLHHFHCWIEHFQNLMVLFAETCAQEDNNLLLLIWFTLMTRNNNRTHNAWASTQLQNDLEVCFVGWSQFNTWVAEASEDDLLVTTRVCNFLYLNFMLECDIQIDFLHRKKKHWIELLNLLQTIWQQQSTLDSLISKCCTGFVFSLQKNANHSINHVLHTCICLEMKW